MPNKKFEIIAKNNRAEIYIYDIIGESWLGGINGEQVVKEIAALKNINEINLRINSDGGDVLEAVAIFNALKRHQARVIVDIDVLAASSASFLAMVGDEINIADNAYIMVHKPFMLAMGTAEGFRQIADRMDNVEKNSIVAAYKTKTGLSDDVLNGLMDTPDNNGTWLNAEESKRLGFVDNITEAMKIAACIHNELFNYIPEGLRNAGDNVKNLDRARRIAANNVRFSRARTGR